MIRHPKIDKPEASDGHFDSFPEYRLGFADFSFRDILRAEPTETIG
jgi:hypothetical protein